LLSSLIHRELLFFTNYAHLQEAGKADLPGTTSDEGCGLIFDALPCRSTLVLCQDPALQAGFFSRSLNFSSFGTIFVT